MNAAVRIRPQQATDLGSIEAINAAAFADHGATAAFDEFRAHRDDILSLVALRHGKPAGHVLFSPVTMQTPVGPMAGMGLGQLAVSPEFQNSGIGSHLAETGIAELRNAGCPFIIVIGHANYYPRFGFEIGRKHNVVCQWEGVPDETFMVLFLEQDPIRRQQLTGVAGFDGL